MERWRGALRALGEQAADVGWRYGAFELDPTIPAEGVDARAHLEARYDAATVRSIHQRLAAVAAAEGLPLLDMAELRVRPNTFAAHRLMTEALARGLGVQQAMADALFADPRRADVRARPAPCRERGASVRGAGGRRAAGACRGARLIH